jgi:secretion/DNA translocation related CpaE-like protein
MGRHGLETKRRPLLITSDEQLLDELLRLAATADVDVDVVPDVGSATRGWSTASSVVLDASLLDDLVALHLPRRSGLIVIGHDLDDADVWRRAVNVGADHVIFLPDAAAWLVDTLGDLDSRRQARVIAVMGGCGGAGASTLAAAVALRAADREQSPLLVDADPFGGGIDLLLGTEDCSGIRWQDLCDASGRIDHQQLLEALPRDRGLPFLSWSRRESRVPDDAATRAVVSSVVRNPGPVVFDLAHDRSTLTQQVLTVTSTAIVIVPARVRAVAAASTFLGQLRSIVHDVRLVVRRPAPGGLTVDDIERTLDVPLIGSLPNDSRRAEWEENGLPPSDKGIWRRLCDEILSEDSRTRRVA